VAAGDGVAGLTLFEVKAIGWVESPLRASGGGSRAAARCLAGKSPEPVVTTALPEPAPADPLLLRQPAEET
jgi:hypothetical protein